MFTEFQKTEILHRINKSAANIEEFLSDDPEDFFEAESSLKSTIILRDKVESGSSDFTFEEAEFIHSELKELIAIAKANPQDFETKELFFLTSRRLNDAIKKIRAAFPEII